MLQIIEDLGSWDWFIAGGLLLILEMLVPGVFMFWLGLAALTVGFISLAVDWPLQFQLVAFAAISVALIPIWRHIARRVEGPTDQPFLNRRTDAFIGRVFTLEKPIIDGSGTVGIDDTVWRITGADAPAGRRVKVTRVAGAALHVEPVIET